MRWLLATALLTSCSSSSSSTPADAASDSSVDVCLTCALGQICVASYDGTCKGGAGCVTKTVDCPLNACSAECQAAYCSAPYQCMTRSPCGGESVHAFTCDGP
jgi:hypothetical protein